MPQLSQLWAKGNDLALEGQWEHTKRIAATIQHESQLLFIEYSFTMQACEGSSEHLQSHSHIQLGISMVLSAWNGIARSEGHVWVQEVPQHTARA